MADFRAATGKEKGNWIIVLCQRVRTFPKHDGAMSKEHGSHIESAVTGQIKENLSNYHSNNTKMIAMDYNLLNKWFYVR